jgi:hypothetical protein
MFSRVRDTFASQFRSTMERLEVEVLQERDDGWCAVKCPLCVDKSGSAGIHSRTGFLKCHQCGFAGELFAWLQKKKNLGTPWEACMFLVEFYSLEKPVRDPKREERVLSDEMVDEFEVTLWGTKNFYVGELAARGFGPEELSQFRIGRTKNGLIFPCWNAAGVLLPRAHLWRGPKVEPRWQWWPRASKDTPTGSPICLWPAWIPPEGNQELWLMEGEWDCLVARTKFGLAAYTWTGGAGSPLIADRLPGWFASRRVNVVYDIDVYHGKDSIDERNKNQQNLFNKVIPTLVERKCEIFVRWVPLDPAKHPKGDFRDWWSNGGRDLTELKVESHELLQTREAKKRSHQDASVSTLGNCVGKAVRFVASVAGVQFDTRIVYERLSIRCDIGNHRACDTCRLPRDHGDGEINLKDSPGLTARLFLAGDIYKSTKQWLHPGPGCPGFEIQELEEQKPAQPRWLWTAGPPTDSDDSYVEVTVLSPTQPAAAKDHLVEGWVAPELTEARPIVEATKVVPAERMPFNISPFVDPLRLITPWNSDRAEDVLGYMDSREAQIGEHTTEIVGMPWARAIEIAAHSALMMPRASGRTERGWVDCCLVGYTRTGKTTTARRLLELYGLGRYASAQSSVSKAGITVTLERTGIGSSGGWRAKPGLFPRLDGQLLILDELHGLVDTHNKTNQVMQELQSARDIGTLEVVKAVNIKYQARVRFVTMANPPQKLGFAHYAYPCEVIKDLYITDESIARTDFMCVGMAMSTTPTVMNKKTQNQWTHQLANALVRRAWDMPPERIHIHPEAETKAEEIVETWASAYSQDLPLFTVAEKARSVLRIAVAVANLCFSHDVDPGQCVVRQCHVEVAKAFLEDTWSQSGYDSWSANRIKKAPPQPLIIERMLWHAIERPEDVNKFEHLAGECGRNIYAEIVGLTSDMNSIRVETWISRMIGAKGLMVSRPGLYVLTDIGRATVSAVAMFIKNSPDTWKGRILTLDSWFNRTIPGAPEPRSLISLQA